MLDWIIDHFFSVVMLPIFLIGWLGARPQEPAPRVRCPAADGTF